MEGIEGTLQGPGRGLILLADVIKTKGPAEENSAGPFLIV